MTVVHSMKVRQDVGSYEPSYITVWLDLHEDGTTTWRPLEKEEVKPGHASVSFAGERVSAVGWY